jgi:xanthine dehydrogenase accessory factor
MELMKEIKSILSFYDEQKAGGLKAAMALVVRVEESSYRREGARMLVFESGLFEGGISGGCLEGDALKRSQMAIFKDKPSVVIYDTSKDDENQIGVGLGCNGLIEVLISPLNEADKNISILRHCAASRQPHIIATVVHVSQVHPDVALGDAFYYDCKTKSLEGCPHAELAANIADSAVEVMGRQKSKTVKYQLDEREVAVFIEWVPPQIHLAIYGDNYDVYPLLGLLEVMDWEVSLVGNLSKLKKQKLRKGTGLFLKSEASRPVIDDRTAILLMAHDYKTDLANLQAAISTDAPYIGVLGPKKRFHKMLTEMAAAGVELDEGQMNRIYAPSGLEIGANTPEEIAASIIAEILAVFSNKRGGSLREKVGPIHDRI